MNQQVNENNNPGAAGEVARAWKQIADEFTEVAVGINTVVNGLSAGWTGQAGTAARQALTKVGTFTDKLSETFTSTGNVVQTQTSAAETAKNSFPKEVPYDPKQMMKDSLTSWNPIDNLTLPFEMMERREESQAAKQEAERVMTVRDNSMASAAAQMPTFESTPQVTNEQGTTQASSTTFSKSTNSVNPNQQFGQPSMPGTGNTGTTNTSWSAPPTTPPNLPGSDLPPGTRPGERPPLTPPPGPFPPGRPGPGRVPPGQPPGRGPGGGPGGRGGGPGGGGPGGRGAGAFGPGGAGGRGAGSFGPASPGGASGVANNAHGPEGAAGRGGAAGGAAGRAGAAGMGGMGAGAGGGQGGEDKEHKSTYLLPSDEYFDDDRMVAPPVIGG